MNIDIFTNQPEWLFPSNTVTIRDVEYANLDGKVFRSIAGFDEVVIMHTPNGAFPLGKPYIKKTILILREQELDGSVGKMIMTFYNPAVTRQHISETLGEPLKPYENGDELVVLTATWIPQDQYEHDLERVLHDQLRI